MNLINGIIELGWKSLVFNDLIGIINIIYMIILLIFVLILYNAGKITNNVFIIFLLLLIISIIRIPEELGGLFYFISAILGINPVISIIPTNQVLYYLIYWGCEGFITVVLLIILIVNLLKRIFKKESQFNLFRFLEQYLVIYFFLIIVNFVFNLGFSMYFGDLFINYVIQQISLLMCLGLGWIFIRCLLKKNSLDKSILIAKASLIFLGIYNILITFNEVNVETPVFIFLQITCGVLLSIFGILFNKTWLNIIQNN
ncbi:MAG: hypothetical protein GF329_13465 [Candidatus Lokiarchaeota archaeon]|nr:hypothetical protein [Candidatus Lokiarchaeota archaeon]